MGLKQVSEEQIKDGRATDAYFERTLETLESAGKNPEVVAEVSTNQFPRDELKVLAGLENAAELFRGVPVDVDALPEGTVFDAGPALRIEGSYQDFAALETSLLGYLSHATGIATAAAECRVAAPETTILSFGARHVHPSMAATVERSALIGGFDGFSHVAAGEELGEEPSGTMPHALQIAFGEGNQEDAWTAFNEAVDDDVPRVALCDTYSDEVQEAIRAAECLGDDLDGIRLDTTSSRRGDFRRIITEVRWELDQRGHTDIDIYVSGGLGPSNLRSLKDVVDGFGVGGYVADADSADFGLDIVTSEGTLCGKRGKLSGKKNRVRRSDGGIKITTNKDDEDLLEPLVRDGEIVREFSIDKAAETARKSIDEWPEGLQRFKENT